MRGQIKCDYPVKSTPKRASQCRYHMARRGQRSNQAKHYKGDGLFLSESVVSSVLELMDILIRLKMKLSLSEASVFSPHSCVHSSPPSPVFSTPLSHHSFRLDRGCELTSGGIRYCSSA